MTALADGLSLPIGGKFTSRERPPSAVLAVYFASNYRLGYIVVAQYACRI